MDPDEVVAETIAAHSELCTSTILPANAIISFGSGNSVMLNEPAVFHVPCSPLIARTQSAQSTDSSSLDSTENPEDSPKVSYFRDPFEASTFPICYALAACTVTSWMLVIMLFITPRSFLDGGVRYLSRRSFRNNRKSARGISIGGRPWLQKLAALTVAASLTVATASTFRIAAIQYSWGAQNAKVLQDKVIDGTKLKIIRLISDTFLWLARAQTLIRLFPRQRERTIIKWVAALLITLDVIFSALNSFMYSDNTGISGITRPRSFVHPIPTLSYLFQLLLGVLYAAWVIYYALMKKRYAFYHPLMKNICLVAVISLGAITVPVVFFIVDISKPAYTVWGDYVRWVGAAAASVVVWEWVERIEALEREVKKDGILGREVFHDDDMLEVNAVEPPLPRHRKSRYYGGSAGGSGASGGFGGDHTDDGSEGGHGGDRSQAFPTGYGWHGVTSIANRYRNQSSADADGNHAQTQRSMGDILRPNLWPTRPAPARATPVSRTDSPSAASTVYAVRYQAGSDVTNRTPDPHLTNSMLDLARQHSIPRSQSEDTASSHQAPISVARNINSVAPAGRRSAEATSERPPTSQASRRTTNHGASSNGQRRSDEETEAETSTSRQEMAEVPNKGAREDFGRWDLRSKLEFFASNQAERIRERLRPTVDTESLPVHVIEAPARRGTALQQVLEEDEFSTGRPSPNLHASRGGPAEGEQGHSGQLQVNPPLWPGVQRRLAYEDDDYSFDEESLTETASSIDGARRHSEEVAARPRGLSTGG